ncbi:protein FAM111B-like [Salarias fasciatus]|uniref:protein FAM111B-like n=1 Tax=Salarias fasciatus TaxID=181472 RepID=UPI001176BBDC|nr:protein FAM111B-like [Salarias fasciatus]
MTTKSQGPMDKVKEDECHPTHSIEWCWSNKRPNIITCKKAGTVEDLLKRSSQFRETAEKQKDKELVIVRDGKAISSHFPCSLIKDERLTLKYVKAKDKPKKTVKFSVPSGELVMFHVSVKGGKNVVRILRNPALKDKVREVTVYAYKGEKVKNALRRDGRFLNIIFKRTCALANISTEVNTEMSNLVDGLEGKTFQIIMLNKSSPPESLSPTHDYSESQEFPTDESFSQQLTTIKTVNEDVPTEDPQTNRDTAAGSLFQEIPRSQIMQKNLSSQFRDLVKTIKTPASKLSRIQNLFRVEYGQNAQMCREVKTMKRLMDLSDSVCQVRVNGSARGSGFLLFGKFVLTNGHVVKDVYNENQRHLDEKVTVHFSFESLEEVEGGREEVEEIVGFEHQPDVLGGDWTLLRLRAQQALPDGLLAHSGFLPQSGGICIIGHPDGGVKKIDPCLIVKHENRNQVVEKHYNENQGQINLITSRFFEGVAQSVQQNQQVLTYESCFYFGSSGSPVFDQNCRVVAMHTGGFIYQTSLGENQSVIEFGHPLPVVIERIIVQAEEKERFDVFKEFIEHSGAQQQNVIAFLKKLIESRNLPRLRNAVNDAVSSSVTAEDENLEFLELVFPKHETVPMEIN